MRAALAALGVVALTLPASTQPTFSARVDGVRVDVLVTDSSRRPLRGLAASDFVIRDNGVPQQVDVVSFGEIALNWHSISARASPERDSISCDRPARR